MSAGAPSFADDQPVVGEPASHRHQTVVVGEPPEDEAPVVGEPAFPNGLQDQQPISPSAVDMTSANGVQSTQHTPLCDDSASPPAPPAEESPNALQVPATTTASIPGIGERGTHETETPMTENTIASSDVEAAGALSTPHAAASAEEVQGFGTSEDTEVTHIEDEPHLPRREVPTDNPFAALEEGAAGEESNADTSLNPEEISSKGLVEDTEVTHIEDEPHVPRREVPTDNPFAALEEGAAGEESDADTSLNPEEISSKGLVDEQQQLSQTEADNGSVEGSRSMTEDNESDVKDANVNQNESSADHTITPAIDQGSISETVQEKKTENIDANDRSMDIPKEPGVTSKEMQHGLIETVPDREDSSVKSSTQKNVDDVPINRDSNNDKESSVEAQLMDSSATLQGTRGIAVEECLANQSPANGDNTHLHDGDGDHASEREQDLPNDKVDDASTVSEKSNSGIKFPLIFTGLAIAVVGVAVAAFSRSR